MHCSLQIAPTNLFTVSDLLAIAIGIKPTTFPKRPTSRCCVDLARIQVHYLVTVQHPDGFSEKRSSQGTPGERIRRQLC